MWRSWILSSLLSLLLSFAPAHAQSTPAPLAEPGGVGGHTVLHAAHSLAAHSLREQGVRFRANRQQALTLARKLVRQGRARLRNDAEGTLLSQRVSRQVVDQWAEQAPPLPGEAEDPETGPFEITLMIENDNLLFGIYAIMAGREMDGTDFGRTHGLTLSMSYGVARGLRLGLDLDTVLFTAPVDSTVTRASSAGVSTIPIHFNELNQIRFRMDWEDPSGGPWVVQLVGGVVIQNRAGSSYVGATGQQALWHEIGRATFNPNLWQFQLVPDGGGITAGPFVGVRAGVHGVIGNRWIRLRARAMAGGEFTYIPHGSHAAVVASMQVEIGPPDMFHGVIGLEQEFDIFFTSGAVTSTTRATVRLASEPFDFWFTMNLFELDPNLQYTLYNFNNRTMTAGLTVRF